MKIFVILFRHFSEELRNLKLVWGSCRSIFFCNFIFIFFSTLCVQNTVVYVIWLFYYSFRYYFFSLILILFLTYRYWGITFTYIYGATCLQYIAKQLALIICLYFSLSLLQSFRIKTFVWNTHVIDNFEYCQLSIVSNKTLDLH